MTLRNLVHMVRGRERADWARASLLASLLAEPSRDPKKRRKPFTPDDFTPDWN